MNNSQIPILDSLRAFAALSVCLYHFVCTTTGYITNDFIISIFSVGKYGVQLFFVISGFVIPWAMYQAKFEFKNFTSFVLKRLTRLEPPYIVSILLALFILYVRENYWGLENKHISISVNQVMLHFGYLIPFFTQYNWLNQVYWTLAIEFQYYFFIAILFIPLVKSNWKLRGLIYCIILTMSFFGTEAFLPYWLPVFLVGIILFLFKARLILSSEYYLVSGITFLVCLSKYPLASVVYTIIPVLFILYLSEMKIKVLNFIGKMSYSLYLIHTLIGATLVNVLSHSVQSALGKFLVIFSGITVSLLSAYLMYLLIEKFSKRLSASIKYR